MYDKLIGFDFETTGTDPETARIVSANITVRDLTRKEDDIVLNWLIDPGVDIPEDATAVHGISTEYARYYGEQPERALRDIAQTLDELYAGGGTLVVFNAGYDLPLLNNELARYGLLPTTDYQRVIDPLVIDRAMDKYRKGKRTLTAMCPVYGVKVSLDAHDAKADVAMTLQLAEAMLRRFDFPDNEDDLYRFQRNAHRVWADNFGNWLRSQGKQDNVDRDWI